MYTDYLKIFYCSIGSIFTLFILTKFMGARQMSQLSMFDYINGITIGSIAAEMATAIDDNYIEPLAAMIIYGFAALILSKTAQKSIVLRRFILGRSVFIYNDGNLYMKNLNKANIDLSEFLTQCRVAGYFDLSKLQSAILEPNGRISFLPLSEEAPVTLKDLNIQSKPNAVMANIIIDGHIMKQNLRRTGHDLKWLQNQLLKHNITNAKEVFLATCDKNNQINIYVKINKSNNTNIFE